MNVDLNVDMGESFGMYKMGNDEAIMPFITSANVACGFHAGDPTVMKKTVDFAAQHGVQVGAHPGFPDMQGFGRREIDMTKDEIYADILYQIGAVKGFVEAAGMRLHHVKPHGKLYGLAHRNEDVARAICQAIIDVDKDLYFYCMKKGVVENMANDMGVRTVFELYADLGYDGAGNLVITRHHDSHNAEDVVAKVLKMLNEGKVLTTDGTEIDIEGSSICVHSDSPGFLDIITAIRKGLDKAGYMITSPTL